MVFRSNDFREEEEDEKVMLECFKFYFGVWNVGYEKCIGGILCGIVILRRIRNNKIMVWSFFEILN